MDDLPFEIEKAIFQHLTHRNLSFCAIVCKKWHQVILQSCFYSKIEMGSIQQLIKFIEMTKKKKVRQQQKEIPLSYCVQHIKLHYTIEWYGNLLQDIISTFPNLQSIETLQKGDCPNKYITRYYPSSPLLLDHISYLYRLENQLWIESLPPEINNSQLITMAFNACYTDSFNQLFFLKPIGSVKTIQTSHGLRPGRNRVIKLMKDPLLRRHHILHQNNRNNNNNAHTYTYQSKIIALPTLYYLTSLKIRFSSKRSRSELHELELDERVLEVIHKSCPQLIILHLYNYYMNISEDYDTLMYDYIVTGLQKKIIPAITMKELVMKNCILYDPKCYYYFTKKYPQLESYQHNDGLYRYEYGDETLFRPLQLALFNMITRLPLLKRLSIHYHPFYLHDEFLQWLNNHPQQLVYLEYFNSIYPSKLKSTSTSTSTSPLSSSSSLSPLNNNINHSNHFIDLNKDTSDTTIIHDSLYSNNLLFSNESFNFFNYLTSLSVQSTTFMESIINYLLHHQHTLVISYSIKELEIKKDTYSDETLHYLFDWLELFPHLQKLKSISQLLIDNDDDNNNDNNNNNNNNILDHLDDDNYMKYEIKNEECKINQIHINKYNYHIIKNNNKLHQLIKHRRQQQLSIKEINNKTYQLKRLEIIHGSFLFKNGFYPFFKKFSQLNQLILNNCLYFHIEWYDQTILPPTIQEISMHMIHLYLDFISIINMKVVAWNTYKKNNSDQYFFFGNHSIGKQIQRLSISEISLCKEKTDIMEYKSSSSNSIFYEREANPYQLMNRNNGGHFTLHIYSRYIDKIVFIND